MNNFPVLSEKAHLHCRAMPNELFYDGPKGGDAKLGNRKMPYNGVWMDGKLNGDRTFGTRLEGWYFSTREKSSGQPKGNNLESQQL